MRRLAAGRGSDPEDDVVLRHGLRVGQKSFIRRLVKKARFLMQGGYLELAAGLRPRM